MPWGSAASVSSRPSAAKAVPWDEPFCPKQTRKIAALGLCPSRLIQLASSPTAYAVGWILSPLRGWIGSVPTFLKSREIWTRGIRRTIRTCGVLRGWIGAVPTSRKSWRNLDTRHSSHSPHVRDLRLDCAVPTSRRSWRDMRHSRTGVSAPHLRHPSARSARMGTTHPASVYYSSA
jgi:hypothetical protein